MPREKRTPPATRMEVPTDFEPDLNLLEEQRGSGVTRSKGMSIGVLILAAGLGLAFPKAGRADVIYLGYSHHNQAVVDNAVVTNVSPQNISLHFQGAEDHPLSFDSRYVLALESSVVRQPVGSLVERDYPLTRQQALAKYEDAKDKYDSVVRQAEKDLPRMVKEQQSPTFSDWLRGLQARFIALLFYIPLATLGTALAISFWNRIRRPEIFLLREGDDFQSRGRISEAKDSWGKAERKALAKRNCDVLAQLGDRFNVNNEEERAIRLWTTAAEGYLRQRNTGKVQEMIQRFEKANDPDSAEELRQRLNPPRLPDY